MGKRKTEYANQMKEARKHVYFAKMNDVPTSPRKMRLVADMIRGVEVNKALGMLRYSKKEASRNMEKLLRSAIANWEVKNEKKVGEETLYVTKVFVDCGRTLKRLRPAPQGRGYRVRKRSNHITIFVDTKAEVVKPEANVKTDNE
ncbi:MAG: 50S ribosomal protein L22 [Bacteroidales bacterium]|nr:50S ribosomal protein L22 [Bacteroidales bacterium]